jgi:hypothetical protein
VDHDDLRRSRTRTWGGKLIRSASPMEPRNSNLVVAAVVLGVCLVLAAGVFVGGMWLALDHAAARLGADVRDAGQTVHSGGDGIAGAINNAGQTIGHAQVMIGGPLVIREPLKVRGVADDGSMPIDARIAK